MHCGVDNEIEIKRNEYVNKKKVKHVNKEREIWK